MILQEKGLHMTAILQDLPDVSGPTETEVMEALEELSDNPANEEALALLEQMVRRVGAPRYVKLKLYLEYPFVKDPFSAEILYLGLVIPRCNRTNYFGLQITAIYIAFAISYKKN